MAQKEDYRIEEKSIDGELNILNVGPMPPRTGGSCFVNNETLTNLAKRGHRVRCITQAPYSQIEKSDYDAAWRGTGLDVFPVPAEFVQSSERLSDKEYARRKEDIVDVMDELIMKERPDVLMTGHESYAAYANEAARKQGIPVVQVLHGTPTHLVGRGEYPADLTERFLDSVGQATLVVGVSNALANIVRSHGIKQTTYIHNGTDTKHFKPREGIDEEFLKYIGAGIEDKVVLHASTLRDIKRPLDIVESSRHALDKDPSLYYVIVGDGLLREEMRERAVSAGVDGRFKFVGRVEYESIPQYFQHADLFLLPSENEGFGRVLREAQACKTVPIASDLEATREVISHGETGCLFEKGDVEALAEMTLTLSRDKEGRERMANRGYDTATTHDLVNMVSMYEQVLGRYSKGVA